MASRSSTWKPKPLPRSKICFFKPSVCDWGLLFAAVNKKIRNYAQNPVMGARCAPDSFSHGYAVPDLRHSACLLPAQRAASSTPSKRELFYQIILRLSNKLRRTRRDAHCASAFCAEFAFCSMITPFFAKQKLRPPYRRTEQLVDISKLGLNSKIKKVSDSFICGKGYSPPSGGE